MLLRFACALLLAFASPASAEPPEDAPLVDLDPDRPPPEVSFDAPGEEALLLSADLLELEDDSDGGRVRASGNVRLRSGTLQLSAPALVFDRTARTAVLDGGVSGVDGAARLSATALELELDTRKVRLVDGELRLFDTTNPKRTRLTLRAESIARPHGSVIEADELWLTTCDCAPDTVPLLAVSAAHARIEPGENAELTWALVRIFDLPVLPVPWLSLPLASRRSGVLFPVLLLSGPGGAGAELPVFITLGESADLTLRPRWLLGTESAAKGGRGVSGPALEAELRWAPFEGSSGSFRVTDHYDLSPRNAGGGEVRGHRGGLSLVHDQALPAGRLAIDAELTSDAAFLRDTSPLLERAALPYLRSRAGASFDLGRTLVAVGSTVIQPLESAIAGDLAADRRRFTDVPGALAPLASAHLFHDVDAGAFAADVTGRLTLESSVLGTAPVGRTPRLVTELAVRPTYALWRQPGGLVLLEAGGRAQGLLRERPAVDDPGFRLAGWAGVRSELRLEKPLDGGWLHTLTPALRVRAWGALGTPFGTLQSAPSSAELSDPDRAAAAFAIARSVQGIGDAVLPPGAGVQAIARIGTAWRRGGYMPLALSAALHPTLTDFDPGQLRFGLDSMLGEGELLGRIGAWGAWDLALERPASAGARWRKGLGIGVVELGGAWIDRAGSVDDQLLRPVDALFLPRARVVSAPDPIVQLDAIADFAPGAGLHVRLAGAVSRTQLGGHLSQQYAGTVSWDAGGCARLWASAGWANGVWFGGGGFELGDLTSALASLSGIR